MGEIGIQKLLREFAACCSSLTINSAFFAMDVSRDFFIDGKTVFVTVVADSSASVRALCTYLDISLFFFPKIRSYNNLSLSLTLSLLSLSNGAFSSAVFKRNDRSLL